ncbi:NADPH2:quinone reductase [Labrenzia sp. EL_208]|uniref:Quinone oxidoreductase 1 n=1 Tax=Roseibium album TaxID=311410 RepID=A0A0M6ZHV1_9HYPH|nr:quinone oxidoreductase [Roseibium album]MBG6156216.1 NADPH2:quinone reductase [Labrenzia sp. EL_162]MBG6176829.1 NADPH2:quinone reductase [Labrenzia sp. EL_132]MBG6194749.1 NADPH2:quinone reductase [Labrenzia sp. EL_159]MBG6231446.1 NADPH2:quinone reductase [Labrenzia sp. EL_208]MCR9059326.1 quinone oxidoreductase [Paracoccaceae bacterium]
MVQAIRVHETGGPDVMRWEQVDVGEPGPGEVRIRHTAIGLNFIDTYFRSGLYPSPAGLPFSPGNEGAGIVQSVGDGVAHLNPGDRVAYAGPLGAYAQERVVPADNLVVIPDGIDDKTAAAMMLKGMTAQYLLRQTFAVGPDTTLLFHAAAGGVGLIAGQWAAHLGATVIGTAGSDEKIALAKAHGYQHMINYRTEDFVERVKEITGGKGCDVVYDSVGQDTYPGSLDCIRPLGTWVSFGQSSGPITDFNLGLLAQKGSLFATRPTLFTYIATRDALEATAGELFDVVQRGIVKIELNQEYRLANAIQAHEDLEGRKTTGTTVLIP